MQARRQLSKLAKKAKMMSSIESYFSIPFAGFEIEFVICKALSVERTKNLRSSHGDDFVFVASEAWLRTVDSRCLILPAQNPGNLVEELRLFGRQLIDPLAIAGLEDAIPQGKWCEWMNDYWERMSLGCEQPKDDELYDLLSPLLVVESRIGYVAAYRYHGHPTIEIATRRGEGIEAINVWAEFSPAKTFSDVEFLIRALTLEIDELVRN